MKSDQVNDEIVKKNNKIIKIHPSFLFLNEKVYICILGQIANRECH